MRLLASRFRRYGTTDTRMVWCRPEAVLKFPNANRHQAIILQVMLDAWTDWEQECSNWSG